MKFNKETIIGLSNEDLSEFDKRYLIAKYFPYTEPDWKKNLQKKWNQAQYEKLWNAYEGISEYGESGETYRYSHDIIRKLAASIPPKKRYNTVTSFTKWLMSLYLNSPNQGSLREGKMVERIAAKLPKPSQNSEWEVIYSDPLDKKPTPLKISSLTIGGSPLWGAPDVVYKNKVDSRIIIVERKSTDWPVPCDGWPNLRAQLWAYSKIDEFQRHGEITLVGEVWGSLGGLIRRKKVLRWSSNDTELNNQNSELFQIFGGSINV